MLTRMIRMTVVTGFAGQWVALGCTELNSAVLDSVLCTGLL